MVSYYYMEVDGGETESFIVKTYTFLAVTSLVKEKKKLFSTRRYT
jgi:hypothetical protein